MKLRILMVLGFICLSFVACKANSDSLVREADEVMTYSGPVNDKLSGRIEFVNWMTENPDVYQEVIKKFNEEYPNIEVVLTTLPFNEARSYIITRHSAGMSADIYQLNLPWIHELVDMGVLAPLDEMIESDTVFKQEDMAQELMQEINGRTYMVPLTMMHFVLYCNKEHFEEAGLALPKTWEELKSAAIQLTDEEKDRYGYSFSMSSSGAENGPVLSLYPLLYSAGGRTIVNGKANINSAEVLEMMNFVDDLYSCGGVRPGTLTKNGSQVIDDFSAGKASMMIQPSLHIATIRNINPNIQFDVVRVPGPEANNIEATRLHGFQLGISSTANNPKLAWTFISWMNRPENNGWIAGQFGQMPANLRADTSYLQKDDLYRKTYAMMRNLENVEELMSTPETIDTWRIYTDYTQQMLLDEITPEEAVEYIQEEWEILFSK